MNEFSDLIKAHDYVLIMNVDTISPWITELILAKFVPCLSLSQIAYKIDTSNNNEYFLNESRKLIHASLLLKTIDSVLIYLPVFGQNSVESIVRDINTPAFSVLNYFYENKYITVCNIDIREHNIKLKFPHGIRLPLILLLNSGTNVADEPYVESHADIIDRYIRNRDLTRFRLNIPPARKLLSRAAEVKDVLVQLKSPVDEIAMRARDIDKYLYKYERDYPF